MHKIKLFVITFISILILTTNVYADSTSFNVTWAKDEFIYTGSEIVYKPEPNVDHVQVEYIESTGTQAINTGILASTNNGFELDMVLLTDNEWAHVIGGAETHGDSKWHNGIIFNGKYAATDAEKNIVEITINVNNYKTDDYRKTYSGFMKGTRHTVSYINRMFNISDLFASPVDTSSSPEILGKYNWYLFATNNDNQTNFGGTSKIRLYGCKMYVGTTVERDYIPVVVIKDQPKEKNSDGANPIPAGTVCLYDKKNGLYYLNVGTGNFIPGIKLNGETYKVLESLKPSGSTYFDTNYNATINTKWIIEYRFNSAVNSHLGGGENEDDKRFCIVNDTSITGNVLFGIGSKGSTAIPANTNKHIYVLDGPNRRGLIDGKIEANTTSDTVSNTRLYIFGRCGYDVHPTHTADLYNSKIFSNNSLVKNYIPVKRDSDGKVGIYDLINKELLFDSNGNPFTAGNYDAYTGENFLRIDKKTNAGEYITYPLSNLANALYSGADTAFDRTWKINRVIITPSFNAYNGVYNNLEHPFSFVEAKNQNKEVVDSSKFTIKYYTDNTYSTEVGDETSINADHSNFKDVQTFTFFYKLVPTDTTNYEGSQGPITIKVYKKSSSSPKYVVPNTSVY